MKPYINSFVRDSENNVDVNNIDNYVFLKIIGVNHDYNSAADPLKSNKSGLTFMTCNALPVEYNKSTAINDAMSGLGAAFTGNINSVKKFHYNQAQASVVSCDESLFVPSYSEFYRQNINANWADFDYLNNGLDSDDGQVIFNADNPATEGYCYEAFNISNINGSGENSCFADFWKANSWPKMNQVLPVLTSSVYFDETSNVYKNIYLDQHGSFKDADIDTNVTLHVCFCF